MAVADRRRAVLQAVAALAARLDISPIDLSIIHDSNNTVVDLGPPRIVAKVATSVLPDRRHALTRELAVLEFVQRTNAPVVRLTNRAPAGPHESHGLTVIFLERLDLNEEPVTIADAVSALGRTHVALAGCDTELPPFTDTLQAAQALYRDAQRTPRLSGDERLYCLNAGEHLLSRLTASNHQTIVLHGDPWIGGNLVNTTEGPFLLDFEAACRGPREWDLSSLGADANHNVDTDLFADCLAARSFLVAALCFAQLGRSPEIDTAAAVHLRLLHERLKQ